jgi:FlaA1/EpsC-like NDP-sugar epimerase
MRVLVTGGDGYLGRIVCKQLALRGDEPVVYDRPNSVLWPVTLADHAQECDTVLHLAAHKHAPYGEEHPAEVAETNITGTRNVVDVFGSNVVLASTCKAADPMTCYGASKLIAERIVLNAGGRVVRLVNVWGSSGSVAETWAGLPKGAPIPVTNAVRMWITPMEAVRLLTDALAWPAGRYAPAAPRRATMYEMARETYPDRLVSRVALRRGDRRVERLTGEHEHAAPYVKGAVRILHPADRPAVRKAALRAA